MVTHRKYRVTGKKIRIAKHGRILFCHLCDAGRSGKDFNLMNISNDKTFLAFFELYAKKSETRIYRGVSSDKHTLRPQP